MKRKVYQWHKLSQADLLQIRQYVGSEVKTILDACTTDTLVETIWHKIKNISNDVLENQIPSKMTSSRYSQPWVDRKCRSLFRRKKKAYNKATRTNIQADWDRFRHLQKETQKQCNKSSATFLANRISQDSDTNRKTLYKFIKNSRTDNSGVATLTKDGKTLTSPKDKANALNQQFSSVFSPILDYIPSLGPAKAPKIKDIVFNTSGIEKLLRNSKPNKSSGPDNIPAKFLKETAEELAPALTLLFQASMTQSQIPADWRHARVSPLYKSGKNDRSKPANYRPISLTCLICKVMEHVVCSHLMGHLDTHKVLNDSQHAFRKGRSCETQLILTVNDLSGALDAGKQIDCVLLDFAKAFDKVSHRRLLAKLKNYGIEGLTLGWIKDFLHARTQVVVVDGDESSIAPVTSGVPQGTVLGPALFLVYINDLPEGLRCTSRLFADDCILYRVIDSDADTDMLQQDLQQLESWEREWAMEFAAEKCQVLTITRKLNRNIILRNYKIHGHILDRVDSAKYLGVILDRKLTFKPHINSITKKAHSTRQFLQRTLTHCDQRSKAQAYTTFVRPIVEYASSVWDPHVWNKSQTAQLEATQNKAARFVCSNWRRTASVSAMREQLQWLSLQERRARARVCIMHKIFYGLVAIPLEPHFVPSAQSMSTRGAHVKFTPGTYNTISHRRTFMVAAPAMWNGLPAHMTRMPDPEAFRSAITAVRLTT